MTFSGPLEGHDRLVLTDGGILENLGTQTLLRSTRFGTKHIVVSDAGVTELPWQPGLLGRVRSAFAYALSADTLDRLLVVMSSKQNRSMRELIMGELVANARSREADRVLLFARVAQDWEPLVTAVPNWRLVQLGAPPSTSARGAREVRLILESVGVDLAGARAIYDEMGGEKAVKRANSVVTNFTGLSPDELDVLEAHARWQVHAMFAIFGGALAPRVDER